MHIAIEAFLGHIIAGFDTHEADVESRVSIRGKIQGARDLQYAHGLIRDDVISYRMAAANKDVLAGLGDTLPLPGARIGPGTGLRAAHRLRDDSMLMIRFGLYC